MEQAAWIAQARAVGENAYAKASGFRVGAVVVGSDGRAFAGCNVENASYGLTLCAERAAVARAVAEGVTALTRCVIYTPTAEATFPCGACRQVLMEFAADGDMEVVLASEAGVETHRLADLLSRPFRFAREGER